MFPIPRRRFLHGTTVLAAAAVLPGGTSDIWSVDAGHVRVAAGPWPGSDYLPPGIHFENLLLRMPDGVRLNAILYLPESVRRGAKVGVQLTSDPYRTEPNGWASRELAGWAQDGFGGMYLDVRGSGGSDGVPLDEYMPAEYDDLVNVIDWISRQPWSNGAVGMYGTSYSAFNSIWAAAYYKPKALKAIFVRGGTDDRYTDDIHSPGGIMMMTDNSWALGMITDNATPGAPFYDMNSKASLDRWNTPPWLGTFLNNQLDGPHYRRGSLAPDQYGLLTTPTYLAGGYRDMYQNFVPRIMHNSPAYTQGILGPWHHSMTWPGPVLDWRRMQSRWFDHFLNGRDNGVMAEPRVKFFMPEWRRQKFRDPGPIPGEWRFADSWPASVFAPGRKLFLQAGAGQGGDLAELAPGAGELTLPYHPATGGFSESIGPSSYEGYYGIDSREDDSWGLCFDTPPLRAPVEILGFVKARLFASATAPQANWIVRVNDVAPDGTSYIVTYGFLNGTHRHSHVHPEALPVGEMVELAFDLFCTGYRFSPGHRIRVVVTNAYFPVVWPSPFAMSTQLFTGGEHASHVALPVLEAWHGLPGHLPVLADKLAPGDLDEGMTAYVVDHDLVSGSVRVDWKMGNDRIGCAVSDADPAHAALTVSTHEHFKPLNRAADGGARDVESHTEGVLRSTVDKFHMDVTCTLLENGKTVRSKQWVTEVKRQLV